MARMKRHFADGAVDHRSHDEQNATIPCRVA